MYKLGTLFIIAFLFTSCGNKQQKERLQFERDSVLIENQQLISFIDAVSESMDSIICQEGVILDFSNGDGMPLPTYEQIEQKLDFFQEVLNRQRQRITELETSLENTYNAQTAKLQNIIKGLNKQIEEKDAVIAQLREELNSKNFDLNKLRSRISLLNENVSELSQRTLEQEETINVQSDMMNEGYLKVGTKKDLEAAGLLSKSNLFSRKKLDVSNMDISLFTKIDMREFHEYIIPGKSPKILTPIPESAYRIEKNGSQTCTLIVVDPTLFWSVSNFLIIQYK